MPEPRRVFRIETTAAARLARRAGSASDSPHHGEILQALGALQALMAASPPLPPGTAMAARENTGADGNGTALHTDNMARIAQELDAVAAGTTQATQKILIAAEEIDQLANTLSAALNGRIEQDLAQDILDSVLRIFEACNFQDVIGQHIAKVMKTLKAGDASPARLDNAAPALHGPRLDGDNGHMSQSEIDALFGS